MKYCLVLLTITMGLTSTASAQQPPSEAGDQKLTEGLLDLLNEPEKQAPVRPPETKPSEPAKRGDGEDLGQSPEHPLQPVKQSMLQLSEWIRTGSEPKQTQQLQRDVVLRLDDLIAQLEQQSASQSRAPQSPGSQTSNSQSGRDQSNSGAEHSADSERARGSRPRNSSGKQQAESSQSSSENMAGDTSRGQQNAGASGNEQSGDSQPGNSPLGNRKPIIDLNDPTALQRSAWGNLPDRLRQQMQSRAVERFLPGYREEIEAYYRALAK